MKKLDPIYSTKPALALLTRLRKIIAKLPDTTETVSWGHPTFKAGDKPFAIFERFKGELGLVVKVEKELHSLFLKDARFYSTPYIGKQGWVTLRMEGVPVDWKEVAGIIQGSYRLITIAKAATRKRAASNQVRNEIDNTK